MSDYDDSSLRRSTRSRRAWVATIGFRARKLFLFIAPFSAGQLRLNHCASPYWMGRTRCMVYSRRHSRSAEARPTLELRPSSLTAVNKVSNIPFDRTPMAPGEEAREKSPEKLFFFSATFSRDSNSSNLSQRLASFVKKTKGENREELEGKLRSYRVRRLFFWNKILNKIWNS